MQLILSTHSLIEKNFALPIKVVSLAGAGWFGGIPIFTEQASLY